MDLLAQPLWAAFAVFGVTVLAIAAAGTAMAQVADRLADRSGLGEAITGGLLLGASTSLSGFVTSVSTAWQGFPDLALSNAVGGIAVQTAFLAIADITYRRANLEHAAASLTNLTQGALLVGLLSLPLVAGLTPPVTLLGCHPASFVILIAYLFGMRLASQTHKEPLWGPKQTEETRTDVPEEPQGGRALYVLLARFGLLFVIVGLAGYALGQAGIAIAGKTGLSETIVGTLLTAVSTSLPELVTTLAAVRRGALTLAVGGIIGGNTFDVILVAASDIAYRDGSIYHATSQQPVFVIALTIMLTAVLLLGLLRREKYGFANIGFESLLILLIYLGGTAVLVATG
ncbi:sodium:calcium antiporter [Pelagibius sp. CAU 1746]|uniref:sodium:calcium antiporter n=1 Tax=Pelagibius sp. CAU 1746 TaxID=3140370 RepID=UPI00325C2901